jgi:hypothetical protein
MSFQCEAGTFTLNTGTGNQTVSLSDGTLTPKALILWTTRQTADGITTDAIFFIGFGTSSTARATFGGTSQDAQATSVADRTCDNDKILQTRAVNGGAVQEELDLVSFGAGQFVVNVTVAGTAINVHYLALGGSDLTNANVVEFTNTAGTGTQDVTGVGFQPDFVMLLGGEHIAGDETRNSLTLGLGFATATQQATVGWYAVDGAVTTNTERCQRTDGCLAWPNGSAAFRFFYTFSQFLSDGFQVTKTTNPATGRFFWALCLKGGQYQVGSDTQKTSTAGTKATTTTFQPTGVLLASFCRESTTSVVAESRMSFGAASSASARAASWNGDTDNLADSETDRAMEQDQCLLIADSGSPAGYAAAADLSGFNATDFTLDWDDGAGGNPDATARQFVFAAFGSTAAAGTLLPFVTNKLANRHALIGGRAL